MSALLGLWLSSLACKYKDLQGQRGEAVPAGWEKNPENQRSQTNSETLLIITRERGSRIYILSLLLVSVIINRYL